MKEVVREEGLRGGGVGVGMDIGREEMVVWYWRVGDCWYPAESSECLEGRRGGWRVG